MSERLNGAPVAAAIDAQSAMQIAALRKKQITPALAVVRIGEKTADITYENSIKKHAAAVGLTVLSVTADPSKTTTESLLHAIEALNQNEAVHGILLLRPLPKELDENAICAAIAPEKDVDGVTLSSLAGVFLNQSVGFPPCTAQACLAILKYYQIDMTGKKICVIGRSAVIGRPVAMMLVAENATVTICHTRTQNLSKEVLAADIVIAAAGHQNTVTPEMVHASQILVDVGINFDEKGRMCGDIVPEAAAIAAAYTPVPGGVGAVTTAILCAHVVSAAENIKKHS